MGATAIQALPFLRSLHSRGSVEHSSYPQDNAGVLLDTLLAKFPCEGKSAAVIGTVRPWIEAILFGNNAKEVRGCPLLVSMGDGDDAAGVNARLSACASSVDHCNKD